MSENPSKATFAELRELISHFPGANETARNFAREREGQLTKPPGALGRLEEVSEWFASWQGKDRPEIKRPRVAVFAGNHGVAAQGVSAFPQEVTVQMVANFQHGGAAVNQLCKAHDAELRVYEMALENPTEDFTQAPAMTEEECATAVSYGMMAVEDGLDCLCVGEMGIANSTSGAALAHALFGGEARDWVGPGTGVQGEAFENKVRVVGEAVALHQAAMTDPLEVLRHLGGFELAAIVGAVIAARIARVPVILDGYATTAAASVLFKMDPHALDHCIVGHLSAEPSHIHLLEAIGKQPLVNLNMRLGEASGAAVALGIVKSALACHNGMATFAEAGVSGA
ncbi:nicotinate-nucleotide--dimethylbenzimidazole phosphoribosyltransferase [Aestuariispira insulae]|uniref:Nicotinate-nucleotide--dimethylbenzimidazole phosphoribosyltransferase n=1 Tax=Aestuariispira insulae TaxID=1461337 RepID=A0A3D9HDW4_9PROT|nr:nicotinate-nucleotide--dimethylbenzimidazole phosphoribosyltransferase [Aestuariispira insulae]RED47664.1 nicotinate-nucleotide-dimethylbenzimidazole phosphoribosyltransferase [Aestuariispira insulae]